MCMEYRSDLQGIRALAIIAVLLFHFYPEHFPNGHVGVDQFFVLSGFLMSMMMERDKRFTIRKISNFYYRRIRRIVPSYLLVILLSLITSHFILITYLQAANWESALYALTFTTNIKAADSVRNYLRMLWKASDFFTHTWSIALEMQFYLIFPVIFFMYKSIHNSIANLFLIAIGLISLILHICLPMGYAFNMVHTRLWQFILGILVHQASQHSTNAGLTNKCSNRHVHRIHLITIVTINFCSWPLAHFLLRFVCTFLTAGLIHFHPTVCNSMLSSKCFTYVGKLSYSLYLVHWPIYSITKTQFADNPNSLHFGLVIAVAASVVLTETFEKAYLQANMKTIFLLIICLYAFITAFYINEKSKKFLRHDAKYIAELFTPVCADETLHSPKHCHIPFDRMNFTTEDIIRINEWSSLDDENQLFYSKCSYRINSAPWGWCDLPPQNGAPSHKILVIGNSFAANQGRIVHESCASNGAEVKIYSEAGCEILTRSTAYDHCHDSQRLFHDVVREYKPNVLFILTRHTHLMKTLMTTQRTGKIVENAATVLHDLSQLVTDQIFVLNAIPFPTRTFEVDHAAALRAGKVLDQANFINSTVSITKVRAVVERAVFSCKKCKVIDYMEVFAVNGTFHMFDDRTHLAYINGYWHFSYHGLNQLRPFFKRICDGISYTNLS